MKGNREICGGGSGDGVDLGQRGRVGAKKRAETGISILW